MAFNVVTPENLEYFKQKQDEDNLERFNELYANKVHTHLPSECGAAPKTHSHDMSEVNGLTEALGEKATNIHVHEMVDVTGLQAALDGKADAVHNHTVDSIRDLKTALDAKTDVGHTHTIDNVEGLQTKINDLIEDINAKADVHHSHTSKDITDLQSLFNGKANATHTHTKANVTGLENDLSTINSNISTVNKNISELYSLKAATAISQNSDLNNMKTVGNYVCNLDTTAATITNSPTGGKAFAMKVGDLLNDGKYPYQEVTRYTDGMSWRRTYNMTSKNWNAWYSTSFASSRRSLWTGTWNAGTIEVPGIQNYSVYMFYANSGAMMIGFKSYDGSRINCYGIICPERNVMKLESATLAVSDNTLTRTMPRSWTITGTAFTAADGALVITMIEGLF